MGMDGDSNEKGHFLQLATHLGQYGDALYTTNALHAHHVAQ